LGICLRRTSINSLGFFSKKGGWEVYPPFYPFLILVAFGARLYKPDYQFNFPLFGTFLGKGSKLPCFWGVPGGRVFLGKGRNF